MWVCVLYNSAALLHFSLLLSLSHNKVCDLWRLITIFMKVPRANEIRGIHFSSYLLGRNNMTVDIKTTEMDLKSRTDHDAFFMSVSQRRVRIALFFPQHRTIKRYASS